ncbi:MAG: transcriptional regulator [Gammaproteobacteria bacterium]|nr:MAG: transcriptional regulator [Gammaproteobacteria bacterium]
MPIYEYKCKACEHKFDKLQKINDPVLKDCPDCGESELVKLVSAAGFRLKGTGWYETDFKNSGKKPKESSGSDSSSKSTTKKSTSTN